MDDVRREYLTRLDEALVGPCRTRHSLLREAGDHLDDATDALVEAGWTAAAAARRAVADFGPVDEVAPAFQTTLAVAASRRTAWMLLAALGYQPFLWDDGLELAAAAAQSVPQSGAAATLYSVLDPLIEIGGALVMVGAILALVATGVGHRWFAVGPQVARATAVFALASAALVPLLSASLTVLGGGGSPTLWALVTGLTVAPLGVVAGSARRTLAAI
ncbi:permease prefix domain 1-containing protein [Aeromicrobium sp. CF4.19]|uniref:permease prefix domain 1-containing protein n=1 Tax=Aeromicrobium sp. CF4.19 TaxID=3373082 RepID=UPI003EE70744